MLQFYTLESDMQTNLAYDQLKIFENEKIFSISELSFAIKGEIESRFRSIKIQGEVSGLKKHSSGHTYLSLKDNESVINAICWRGTKINFPLEDGMEVVVKGRVTSYPARSQYQFIIEEASIAGEGALLKLLNERKKLFASLGYFDKKQPLPKFPKIIGIVTSKTGAVLQDMRHRLEDRYPFCQVLVWSVNVQGTNAAEQVAKAIRGFNFMIEKRPDILIVARGGGSIEDLWPFNEEVVVKAVYDSRIPIISAIGHETDTTLIDYASDLRAPTPTAAIELATPVLDDVKTQIYEYATRLQSTLSRILRESNNRLSICAKCFTSSQFAIISISQKFDDKSEKLNLVVSNFIQKEILKLNGIKVPSLKNYITVKKQAFESIKNRFGRISKSFVERYIDRASSMFMRLEQGSFKKVLERGFCFITNSNGQTIESKEDFIKQKEFGVSIHFKDGFIGIN